MNRIAILIDGNNFYKGCQLNFNRTDVDFRKLGQKLSKEIEGQLLRIYYYNAHVSKTIDPLGYQRQQKFFDNLRATPFITLKLGHLVYHRLRTEQGFSSQYFPTEKGIDVQIAVDMVRLGLLKACDGIILVSGDSDYIYAVRFAKDLGSNVYIASFPMGGSSELRNEGDGSIIMDLEFIKDCFIRTMPYMRPEYQRENRIVDTQPTYPDRQQQNYHQNNYQQRPPAYQQNQFRNEQQQQQQQQQQQNAPSYGQNVVQPEPYIVPEPMQDTTPPKDAPGYEAPKDEAAREEAKPKEAVGNKAEEKSPDDTFAPQ
ncbi:MAG: NYN domain-containing protein [Calditrichaeota bacterium]|jgi:uncharacterized LabA/DUF88 family protein|nr:NYN domain-containing protein [Calditrichota bacterium]MBT7787560.1 NYN domain-containing protein [Calditrichota bacterium]